MLESATLIRVSGLITINVLSVAGQPDALHGEQLKN